MEVRQAAADEHATAGRITASAYRGLVRDEASLELDRRVNPDDDPLEAHRAHIRMLGVDPHAQGRGIGTALMRAAERQAIEAGKTEMTLHTTERMAAARAMYDGLGYERTADEVLPDGFVLLGYRKVLDAGSD
jgi:ribosomal protein S18 acetylase RimI-like enzyme